MKILNNTRFVISVVLLIVPSFLSAQDGSQILERVRKKIDSYKTVCADFKQTFRWELADQVQVIEGRICVKGGKRFRIETDDQKVISDGKNIWTVNKLDHQIIVKAAGQESEDHPFLQNFIQNYIDKYKVDKVTRENDVTRLTLKAKSEDEFYPVIRLVINKDYAVTGIIQIDINENSSTYEILRLESDVTLEKSLFSAPDTSGYEIIDMR